MQQHKRLVVILETAIIAAFAMALTYIPHTTGVSAIDSDRGFGDAARGNSCSVGRVCMGDS